MTVEDLTNALASEPPVPVEHVQSEAPQMSDDDALGAAFDRIMTNNGADRGQDGKFVSTKPSEASSGDEDGAGAQPDTTVPEAPPAPANWNGLDDVWKAIPADQREKVRTHFDDLHRRMSDQGRQLASVKPVADRLTDAVSRFPQFKGMTPERLAEGAVQLAAVQAALDSGPDRALETILEVAQAYNVLPALQAKLTGQQMPEGAQEVVSLKREIADLKNQLRQVADPSQIETHVSRVFEGRAAQEAVNQFASDPANSFFAEVEPHLASFIPIAKQAAPSASPKDVLKAAYDMAINAIPDVRAKVQAAAKAAANANDSTRTEAAKKATSINVKSNGTGKGREMSEEESLAAAYDRAFAN